MGLQHKAKLKWDEAEVRAVEKHLMRFITEHKLPHKDDCVRCLEAEPRALRNRSWKGVKDYVRNRITALQRLNGSWKISSITKRCRQEEPHQSSVTSQPSDGEETSTEHQDPVSSSSFGSANPNQQEQRVKKTRTAALKSRDKGSHLKTKFKWDEAEVYAVEKHLMDFITEYRLPHKDDCMRCLEAEPQALGSRSWKGVKDYVRNRITALQRQSGFSKK